MIPVMQLCKPRQIKTLDLHTPVLVPSLSSKGHPQISWIWNNIQDYLTETVLISSYDINYDYLTPKINGPALLFVDSGGYEARRDYDLSEAYTGEYSPKEWTRDRCWNALSRIDTYASQVIVSFDDRHNKVEASAQIDNAKAFFAGYWESLRIFYSNLTYRSFSISPR